MSFSPDLFKMSGQKWDVCAELFKRCDPNDVNNRKSRWAAIPDLMIMSGLKWDACPDITKHYAADMNSGEPKNGANSSRVRVLPSTDFQLYGEIPKAERKVLVRCNICEAVMIPSAYAKHYKDPNHGPRPSPMLSAVKHSQKFVKSGNHATNATSILKKKQQTSRKQHVKIVNGSLANSSSVVSSSVKPASPSPPVTDPAHCFKISKHKKVRFPSKSDSIADKKTDKNPADPVTSTVSVTSTDSEFEDKNVSSKMNVLVSNKLSKSTKTVPDVPIVSSSSKKKTLRSSSHDRSSDKSTAATPEIKNDRKKIKILQNIIIPSKINRKKTTTTTLQTSSGVQTERGSDENAFHKSGFEKNSKSAARDQSEKAISSTITPAKTELEASPGAVASVKVDLKKLKEFKIDSIFTEIAPPLLEFNHANHIRDKSKNIVVKVGKKNSNYRKAPVPAIALQPKLEEKNITAVAVAPRQPTPSVDMLQPPYEIPAPTTPANLDVSVLNNDKNSSSLISYMPMSPQIAGNAVPIYAQSVLQIESAKLRVVKKPIPLIVAIPALHSAQIYAQHPKPLTLSAGGIRKIGLTYKLQNQRIERQRNDITLSIQAQYFDNKNNSSCASMNSYHHRPNILKYSARSNVKAGTGVAVAVSALKRPIVNKHPIADCVNNKHIRLNDVNGFILHADVSESAEAPQHNNSVHEKVTFLSPK